ncbi:MAG: putative LPS assembly protein LptD [Balneolaceae bacterium]|nr:putative LPS assembly protein LptD [Balneolaceae bacterium]
MTNTGSLRLSGRSTSDADSNRVEERQVRGFTTARDFSGSVSLSTTVYGIMNKGIGNLENFRHTIRPSLSFSYRPDFSKSFWGYYKKVQTDTTGTTQKYSIFDNEVFRGPQAGEQQSLGISIDNVFEAKQVRRDSTGEKKERTIRLIDRLNLSTNYNFAADSLKLSNLRASMSSSIIQKINLRADANFNFYERDSLGRKIDQFLLKSTGKPFEMVDFSLNASASFSGGKDGGIQFNDPYYPQNYDPFNQSLFNQFDPRFNQLPVQNLYSPWSLSLNFRYSWRLNPNGENRKSATLNARQIQFRLTPKWSFSTRIGYDFIEKELTPSQFSLNRKLHCWNLSFQMNPFGDFQYFSFRLSVDSSQIQSIFQKLPGLKNLERSSSPSGRGFGGRDFNDI